MNHTIRIYLISENKIKAILIYIGIFNVYRDEFIYEEVSSLYYLFFIILHHSNIYLST